MTGTMRRENFRNLTGEPLKGGRSLLQIAGRPLGLKGNSIKNS